MSVTASLEIIKGIFSYHPDALKIFTLEDLEAEGYKKYQKYLRNNSGVFASSSELKQYAQKERINRYYRTISLIAGRLSRYTVNTKLGGQSLLQAAASAVCAYGVMTFKNADALADIRDRIDAINKQVEQVERTQQKEITEKENVMRTKDITRVKPVTMEVEVEYDSWRPVTIIDTVEEEVDVPINKNGYFFSEKKIVRREVERVEWVKETKKRLETKITGYEEEIVDTVEFVVAQVYKVSTEYLSGGYPAIKLLLGLGLGVQNYCTNQNWSTSMQQGELMAERKLAPLKSKINQLVNKSDGEQELVEILERTLLGSPINIYVTGGTGSGKKALINRLLMETEVMRYIAFQDCSLEIGLFNSTSNCRYFYLPGISAGAHFENINRAALLMPQIDDEFAEPPIMPLEATDTVEVLDFSNCVNPKDKPEQKLITV
ncbi:MAG: hypothetical protein WBA74_14530, partial [Cyclobacteriaceae bacterium]